MQQYLLAEAARCPALQPQDAGKWCWQAAFGGEHLLAEEAAARRYFEAEWAAVPAAAPGTALAEAIAPGCSRVSLAAWKAQGLPPEWLFRLFAAAARSQPRQQEGAARLRECLAAADALAAAGQLPFTAQAWQSWRAQWQAAGPVHHSEAYRAARRPAYRVVAGWALRALPVLAAMGAKPGGVLALDGRSASGKSTLAALLAEVVGAGLIHMDDFFLPPELRTPARLAEPGGNVDYDRFAAEVLPGLAAGGAFGYRVFDCSVMALGGDAQVPAAAWRIVEGAYSCHPRFGGYMALRVFSDVAPAEQLARIRARNGEQMAKRFAAEWIPMEERYFAAFGIPERADLTV